MTITLTASSLTSRKTSDRVPPARRKLLPPLNMLLPNSANWALTFACSRWSCRTGSAEQRPLPWLNIPAWFRAPRKRSCLRRSVAVPRRPADGLTADVVTVNSFDELAALSHDKVTGKIILFNEIFDKQKAAAGQAFAAYSEAVRYRAAGPKAAADLGAVAAWFGRWAVPTTVFRIPDSVFPPAFPLRRSPPKTPTSSFISLPRARSACI